MLGWFAEAPDPDAGLLAFRQVSDALGTTPWYLRLLRDEGAAAERLARVLASSRYAADLLLRAPEAVRAARRRRRAAPARARPRCVAEVLAARRAGTTTREPRSRVARARAPARAVPDRRRPTCSGLARRRREVGEALTDVAAATVAGRARRRACARSRRAGAAPLPTRIAVIAMGRLGGREMGYGSDADVLFVHDPRRGRRRAEAPEAAHAVARRAAPAARAARRPTRR